MIPKVRDAREASSNFAYNLGLGDAPPARSSHSYIEKAEYWAVIWGAVVMTASGVMLWANSLVLRLLPKLWLDVATSIHFYEAVLAALAIVVWHFYSVIFDPDVYPLNTAFLTGYIVKKDESAARAGCAPARHKRHGSPRRLINNHDAQPTEPPAIGGWLSPVIHLSSNWISLAGVILVTTATVFWLFLLPTTLRGEVQNPYMGILAFLVLPGPFFAGLVLIPLGMWLKRKARKARRHLSAGFSPARVEQPGAAQAGLFHPHHHRRQHRHRQPAQLRRRELHGFGHLLRPDLPHVMQPEYTAYQDSPHSKVECVKCHIGPGASWFVQSKLSGVGQVFAVTFNTYPRPIPTPVHNLRPARETCEQCHWPQKYSDRPHRRNHPLCRRRNQHRHQDRAADEDRRRQPRHRHSRHAPGAGRRHPLRALRRSAPDHPLGGVQQQRPQDRLRCRRRQARRRRASPCAKWIVWTATTAPRTPTTCRSARSTKPWRPVWYRPRCRLRGRRLSKS
jgi:hypothetical protein